MHLPTSWMLHCEIFSCACTYTWCCVVRSSLALGDRLDATLGDLLLLLWMHFPTSWMLHCEIFSCICRHAWSYVSEICSCTCTYAWCYVVRSSLALADRLDATIDSTSLSQDSAMDFEAQFGKVTAERQHEKRNIFSLNFASWKGPKHIIH